MKKRTYVSPIGRLWEVYQANIIQAFFRDLSKFGLRVAWYNFWKTL